jgi:hypothetical protein
VGSVSDIKSGGMVVHRAIATTEIIKQLSNSGVLLEDIHSSYSSRGCNGLELRMMLCKNTQTLIDASVTLRVESCKDCDCH